MKFEQLGLISPILRALEACGYREATPIQEKAIPPALAGRDVLGCAQTGTGKTCAFAAPILQRLTDQPRKKGAIRALILTPTRELAIQIGESFRDYGKNLPLRATVIFGGVGQAPQVEQINRGVEILVATPGRLLDLQGQGLVDLSQVEIFVLDEADRMLDMGFIHDVRRILQLLPKKKQTLFFSATMPPEVQNLVDSLLTAPARVAVTPVSSPVEVIRQQVCLVDKGNKTKLLAWLLEQEHIESALVFTRTKHGANKVAGELSKLGIEAAAIHGNKSQSHRQQALGDFKSGALRVLVATDIAARGLDIEALPYVFNYNLPEVPETYIHRIGRTGRAGRDGMAVSFCDFMEKPLLKDIEKLLGKPIPRMEDHPWPMEVFEAPARDARGRRVNAEDAEARAAARARKAQRQAEQKEAPARAAKPAAPASPGQEDAAPAKARGRRGRKKEPAAAAPESVRTPEPAASGKQRVYPKPQREKENRYLNQVVTEGETVNFTRPDPLAGDRVMDATARLFAAKPVHVIRDASHPDKRKNRKESGRPERVHSSERPEPEQKALEKKPVPKARTPRFPEKKAPERRPEREKKFNPIQEDKSRRSRGGRPGRPMERPRSHQKDSTEQPSLMKPYYIKHDD